MRSVKAWSATQEERRSVSACSIGLGYPVENAAVVEQVERHVKDTLHFGTW